MSLFIFIYMYIVGIFILYITTEDNRPQGGIEWFTFYTWPAMPLWVAIFYVLDKYQDYQYKKRMEVEEKKYRDSLHNDDEETEESSETP